MSKNKEKLLTIILPVYNGWPYIKDAVDSILKQTFQNFQLIIVNDGSTDETNKYLAELNNPKITIINKNHSGIIDSFNVAIRTVDTKYIARIDADDIYLPTKFEEQIKFMEENQNVVLVGTDAHYLSNKGIPSFLRVNVPEKDGKILQNLLIKKRAIIQSTIVVRTEIIKNLKGYRKDIYPEDYDLFFRIFPFGEMANITKPLAYIRIHKSYSHYKLKELLHLYDNLITEYHNTNKYKFPIKYKFSHFKNVAIYFKRKGLYYFINNNKLIGILNYFIALLFEPINSIREIISKIK